MPPSSIRKTFPARFAALLLAAAACKLSEPQEAADAFQQRLPRIEDPGWISTTFSDGTETSGVATDPSTPSERLKFESVVAGKICFLKNIVITGAETDGISSTNVDDEKPDFLLKRLSHTPFVVEAFSSLRSVPARPTFVESASVLGEITVVDSQLVSMEGVRHVMSNGKLRTGSFPGRTWTFRLCGKAPALSAATRYITVVHRLDGADDDQTMMYVWGVSADRSQDIEIQ